MEHDVLIIVDGIYICSCATIQEVSEIVIEALGKGSKQIHVKEVVNDD